MKNLNINKLKQYLSIKSITNTTENNQVADYLSKWLSSFCNSVEVVGKINPLVRGYIKGQSNKTLCIYGHYDVQSAVKENGWDTNPFDPKVTQEKIIARGACDNKGQNFAFLSALEEIVKSGEKPAFNILILLEGEEEIGSPHLKQYLLENKEGNKADYFLLADGTSPELEEPAIYTGSLGTVFAELVINNGKGDLHSGIFGSEVPHSAKIMMQMLNDFYTNSDKLISEFKNVEQWSFSVNYLSAGLDPNKSIIPGEVKAMIGYRFSAGIDSQTIISKLEEYVLSKTAGLGVDTSFTTKVVCEAIEVDESSWIFEVCKSKLEKVKLKPYVGRMQGSLPVATILSELYDAKPLIISFGSKDSNTHGANEFMRIGNVERSIDFFTEFLSTEF